MDSVAIVGPGRMGLALGAALLESEAAGRLTVFGRRPEPPSHPLFTQGVARYVFGMEPLDADTKAVFLAVPDPVIPELAHTLAAQGRAPEACAAFHLSASMSTDVFAPLHLAGYAVGALSVLQLVTHPVVGAERIPGSYFSVTGSPEALAVARRLTSAMGSPLLTVPAARRSLCDAAVTMASAFLPALLDGAARTMERAGVDPTEALPSLLPLMRGVLDDVEARGLEVAIPWSRGGPDLETIELHLRALDEEGRALYAFLGSAMARLAGPGLADEDRRALIEMFDHEMGERV